MTERKKTSVWAWVVAALVGLPALYLLSFGPACWIECWLWNGKDELMPPVMGIYRPIGVSIGRRPNWWTHIIYGYGNLGAGYRLRVGFRVRDGHPAFFDTDNPIYY